MIAFAVALVLISCIAASPLSDSSRIVNGEEATLGEIPYIVSIREYGIPQCGGSVLNDYFVLTAAHCVIEGDSSMFTVQYGLVDIAAYVNVVKVKGINVHEKYDYEKHFNDIAILKVEEMRLDFVNSKPIKVPPAGQATPAGSVGLTAGWGRTSTGGAISYKLLKVELNVFTDDDCEAKYEGYPNRKYNFCAGLPEGGKDTCVGDSGGPLHVNGVQVGILSYGGNKCAEKGFPSVFTKVSAYIDWIKSNMK